MTAVVEHPKRFAAFGIPAFRHLWLNTSAFQLSASIQRFAYVWLVLELGGGPSAAGAVTFALGIPVVLFAIPAGSLADRSDKRNLLLVSQVGAIVVSAATALAIWTGVMSVPIAFGLAACLGLVTALGQPVRVSIVPSLVEGPMLMNAIVLMSMAMNFVLIAGPALGGATIRYAGMGGSFALATVLYGAGIATLVPLRLPPRPPIDEGTPQPALRDALAFCVRTPGIRSLFGLLIASGLLLIGPYHSIIPQVARERLGADALGASLLFTVLGVGTLVASLLLALVRRLENTGGWFMVSLVLVGLMMAAMGLSPWYVVSLMVMFVWGIGGGFFMNLNQTLIQSNTPMEIMGRVMSVFTVLQMGLGPLGGLFAGLAAGVFGAPEWATVCGVTLAVIAAFSFVSLPALRRL